jgi:hypothetical protein
VRSIVCLYIPYDRPHPLDEFHIRFYGVQLPETHNEKISISGQWNVALNAVLGTLCLVNQFMLRKHVRDEQLVVGINDQQLIKTGDCIIERIFFLFIYEQNNHISKIKMKKKNW